MRFAWSLRPTDVFVTTFPKSGTTWVGYFLALALSERDGGDQHKFNLSTFRERVPDINDHYYACQSLAEFGHLSQPRAFTLHAPYDRILKRALYVVRDPRDVAVSYYYHRVRRKGDFRMSLSEYVQAFVSEKDVWPCGWGEHVAGWLERQGRSNFLLVRYEDLLNRPVDKFAELLDFVGLTVSGDKLESLVERTAFDRMKKLEIPAPVPAGAEGLRFMRSGKAGSWSDELEPADARLIEERFANLMKRLHYPVSR